MNRGAPASADSSRRVRIAASGALVLAVLIGGSLYLASGAFSSAPSSAGRVTSTRTAAPGCPAAAGTSPCANSPAAMAVAAAPAVAIVPPSRTAVSPHRTKAAPSASASASS